MTSSGITFLLPEGWIPVLVCLGGGGGGCGSEGVGLMFPTAAMDPG